MKVRKSLRSLKNKPGAQIVRRRGKVYVINKKEPRFKARQGYTTGSWKPLAVMVGGFLLRLWGFSSGGFRCSLGEESAAQGGCSGCSNAI